jgi:ribosomal protein L11 methyltransferase
MTTAPPLWKATLVIDRHLSADVCAAFELASSPQAIIVHEQLLQENVVVEALYTAQPDGALLTRLAGHAVEVAELPDQDWIRLSYEGLPPVRAGRFFVYGAHDSARVPHGVIPMRIEAGMAFGTGHHETTALCLTVLSTLARRRRFANVADIGCGTGLLAIAAAKLWRRSVIASDIDAVSVAVARENAIANGAGPLLRSVVADGMAHPQLAARAPYDLILANILAGPLTRLAPQLAPALAPRGALVLSGLLYWQENMVLGFYRPHGLVLRHIVRDGPWSALVLERPAARR